MADFPQYPATSFDQAVDLTIFSGNQLADVINGDATQNVVTESGDIPTLRKALVDNFFFKSPIPWTQGQQVTVFNQLYYFYESTSQNGWYYAPSATSTNPVLMGATPVGDANWRLYSVVSQNTPAEVYPWGTEILTTTTSVSPPYSFDTAIVTFNGITLTDHDYTVNNNIITFTTPLVPEVDAEEPDYLFCYLGRVQQGNPATNYVTYQALATIGSTPGADLVGTVSGNTVQEELDATSSSFQDGAKLFDKNDRVLDRSTTPAQLYYWDGAFPKDVAVGSTPASSGGVGAGKWLPIGDATISAEYGITRIGNGYGYFDTVASATAANLKDGMLATFKGRDTVNDGGGGVFRYEASATTTVDNGIVFAVSGGGRLIRQVRTSLSENQIAEAINVRWFGAKGDAATDDTAAILAAYNYAKSTTLFYTLLFPAGRYVTLTSFVFQDLSQGSLVMDGAVFIGGSNGANNSQQAVVEIRNVVSASIAGPWSITTKPQTGPIVNNPNAYISGLLVRAQPGGVLNPTAGICAFFSVSDLTTIRIGNGIRVGEINNDAQTSEMQFVNCKTPFTINPVQVAGSQTLVSFVGCTLASNTVADITNTTNAAIINDGGAVSIEGGSVEQHSDSSTQMILMGPCSSSAYGNPYGQIAISGAVIETIAPICNITNRFGYTAPASYNSKLSIVGCTGGYIGVIPGTSNLINVFDTTYAGVVAVPDGSLFYAQLSSPTRTGYNINASGNNKVRICVGKTAFDTATGLMSYQAGVAGGIMIHPEVMATASNVTSQSVPATTNTIVIWGNNPTDSVRMGRYHYIVNTSTGAITVPDAGIKSMRFEITVPLDAPTTTGNIMLYRNGTLYQYGIVGGGVCSLNVAIPNPTVGEVITVRLQLSAPSALTSLSKMNVFLAT